MPGGGVSGTFGCDSAGGPVKRPLGDGSRLGDTGNSGGPMGDCLADTGEGGPCNGFPAGGSKLIRQSPIDNRNFHSPSDDGIDPRNFKPDGAASSPIDAGLLYHFVWVLLPEEPCPVGEYGPHVLTPTSRQRFDPRR